MIKFKVGDKVKVKETNACSNCRDRVLTVTDTNRRSGANFETYPIMCSGGTGSDNWEDGNEWFSEWMLELVESKSSNDLKVGDTIRIVRNYPIGNSSEINNLVGKIGMLIRISGPVSLFSFRVVLDNGCCHQVNKVELVESKPNGEVKKMELRIEDIKVGDILKQIEHCSNGENPIVKVIGVGVNSVEHNHKGETTGQDCAFEDGKANICFERTDELFEGVDSIPKVDNTNPLEVDKMKKPETELEKNALALAKKEAIEEKTKEKAEGYKATMRSFITESHEAKRHQAEANKYADVLGITEEEKKELL